MPLTRRYPLNKKKFPSSQLLCYNLSFHPRPGHGPVRQVTVYCLPLPAVISTRAALRFFLMSLPSSSMGTDDLKPKPFESPSYKPMSKLSVILLVLGTNIFTMFLFTGPLSNYRSLHNIPIYTPQQSQILLPSSTISPLLAKLNETEKELLGVKDELKSSRRISESLLAELEELRKFLSILQQVQSPGDDKDKDDPWLQWGGSANRAAMPVELKNFIAPKKLPLGFNPNMASDTIYPAVGHACPLFKNDLARYMDYTPGGVCPDDEILAQQLMLRGCEPLPRRRCHPRTPANYTEPYPFPNSMWTTPPDGSIVWTAYSCKNYDCLIQRKNSKAFDDCKDCFDLQGREKSRWVNAGAGIDYSIDEVLALKKGTIRIGLDIGGGTGTFAVRMRERNVTVITTSMNFNGPFNNFIASRGVLSMYLTVTQRLPFFDNTLDIVHSMHVLSNWIPTELLDFIFYDIYRILRPGGVFWLDRFFCVEDQLKTYVAMIGKQGFSKLKWNIAPKLDRGPELKEMYISALLEKPLQGH